MTSVYDFTVKAADGADHALSAYAGKVGLFVNTASKCGFTPQYEGLQALYRDYADRGFTVLAFPCNQFGAQEPGDAEEIATFCTTRYDVAFPVFAKIDVNGPQADPLWRHLRKSKPGLAGTTAVKWNFTKFLVGRNGRVLHRFPPQATPDQLRRDIEKALAVA